MTSGHAPSFSSAPRASAQAPALVPALDGLRGILTLIVLFHHVFTSVFYILPKEATSSWWPHTSVLLGSEIVLPLYFVISGFVIFLPAARSDGTMGDLGWYAVRRVARIAPAYYLMLLVVILGWPFVITDVPSPMATPRGIQVVLGHLTFLQKALFDEVDIGFGMNGSVWTLTLEEFFYFTIPFAAPLFFRFPLRALSAALLICLGWRTACLHLPAIFAATSMRPPDALLPSHLFHQFPGYLFPFACGSAAARLYVLYWGKLDSPRKQRTLRLIHYACLAVLAVQIDLAGRYRSFSNGVPTDFQRDLTPAVVFAVLIFCVALGPSAAQRPYVNRVSRFLGDTSYGVYLWHMVLIQIVYRTVHLERATASEASLVLTAWVLPGSLLLGFLSFRFLERPVSLYVRRIWQQRHPPVLLHPVPGQGGK